MILRESIKPCFWRLYYSVTNMEKKKKGRQEAWEKKRAHSYPDYFSHLHLLSQIHNSVHKMEKRRQLKLFPTVPFFQENCKNHGNVNSVIQHIMLSPTEPITSIHDKSV